jgi:hypothetical protein
MLDIGKLLKCFKFSFGTRCRYNNTCNIFGQVLWKNCSKSKICGFYRATGLNEIYLQGILGRSVQEEGNNDILTFFWPLHLVIRVIIWDANMGHLIFNFRLISFRRITRVFSSSLISDLNGLIATLQTTWRRSKLHRICFISLAAFCAGP